MAPKFTSKPGKHGTLYKYQIEYTDKSDPGAPIFEWNTFAYSIDHAADKFYDSDDTGWTILSIARVQEGSKHRWTRHRFAEASRSQSDPFKPRRATFDIATVGGGRETVSG